ncbi:DNA polymerase III subunit delta [Peptococcaceae bacterium 1198_IL3148]
MQYYEKLVNSAKRGVVAPVYLFYGDEVYLREKAVEQFKQGLLLQAADFNMDILDGETTDVHDVVNMAGTPPFMAEKRLVLVKNPPWFSASKRKSSKQNDNVEDSKQAGLEPLIKYLNNPLLTTCLIFNCHDAVDRRKKIFKLVEKVGEAVNFEILKPKDIAKWLEVQARKHHKKLDPQAKELLITSTTMGLTGLVAEWQKLLTYVGKNETITIEDAKKVVHQSVEYRIFDVLDAIGACKYDLALKGIRELLANKEPPQIILAMVARQFRLMLQVNELARYGLPALEIAKRINEKLYPVQNALKLGKNFNRDQLIAALSALAQLDADVKTGRQEFYPGLERLLLDLAVS